MLIPMYAILVVVMSVGTIVIIIINDIYIKIDFSIIFIISINGFILFIK